MISSLTLRLQAKSDDEIADFAVECADKVAWTINKV